VPRNDDFNGAKQEGAGYFQTDDARRPPLPARRCAYLNPAKARGNLRVETDALAEKILFEGKRAVGVVYRQRRSSARRGRGAR
jgi:choline dehydrogenase